MGYGYLKHRAEGIEHREVISNFEFNKKKGRQEAVASKLTA